MIDYLSGPVIHEAFFKKYASKKFLKGRVMSTFFHVYFINDTSSFHSSPSVGQGIYGSIRQRVRVQYFEVACCWRECEDREVTMMLLPQSMQLMFSTRHAL
jgi:hypothetical protein